MDTDQDGLSDGEEADEGTDPLKKDTDGDGVVDGKDGWPLERNIKTARLPVPRYAVMRRVVGDGAYPMFINNNGDIAYYYSEKPPQGDSSAATTDTRFLAIGKTQPEILKNFFYMNDVEPHLNPTSGRGTLAGLADNGAIYGTWPRTRKLPGPPIKIIPYNNFHWAPGASSIDYCGDEFQLPPQFMEDLPRLIGAGSYFSINFVAASDVPFGPGVAWSGRYAPTHSASIAAPGRSNLAHYAPMAFSPANGWVHNETESEDGDMSWNFSGMLTNDNQDVLFQYDGFFRTGKAPDAPSPAPDTYLHLASGPNGQAVTLPVPLSDCGAMNNNRQIIAKDGLVVPNRDAANQWTLVGAPRISNAKKMPKNPKAYWIDLNDSLQVIGSRSADVAGTWTTDNVILINDHDYSLQSLIDPSWQLKTVTKINERGMILATAVKIKNENGTPKPVSQQVSEIVILLPVEPMVDANRDREMSFDSASIHNKDQTTAKKPYRFWLNNDHDIGHDVDGTDHDEDDGQRRH